MKPKLFILQRNMNMIDRLKKIKGQRDKVLMVGSGQSATQSKDYDYESNQWLIIGVNHGWQAAPYWNVVVHSNDCPRDQLPKETPDKIVTYQYGEALSDFGGQQACGYSIMLNASYWVLKWLEPRVIAYLGADMNYIPDKDGKTHFYGIGTDIQSGMSDPDRMTMTYGQNDPEYLTGLYRRFEDVANKQRNCTVYNFSDDARSRLPYDHRTPQEIDHK